MEEKKVVPPPPLPPNYVSINELKERYLKRKQKEQEEEQRRKQEEEEEDLKRREKKVIVRERDDGLPKKKKKNKGKSRKRYDSKKKRNQEVVAVEESGSIANIPVKDGLIVPLEYREINAPVIRVYREEAKGNGPCENVMAEETQFGDMVMRDEKKKKNTRSHRKKKHHDVVVAVGQCGTENKTPVKDVVRVYREKGGGGEAKDNGPREKAVRDDVNVVPGEEGLGKKNQVAVEESALEYGTENKAPVKDVVRVYREKGGEARGNGPCEEAVRDDVMAITTQFENVVPREEGVGKKKKKSIYVKKKNQEVVAVEENVVESENKAPGKGVVQVYRKKAKGDGPREKAVRDDVMAIETQFENVVPREEEGSGKKKKKKKTKTYGKKKNQEVVAEAENVVECGTENKAPVKGVVQVYREKAKGNAGREKAVREATETQFENAVEENVVESEPVVKEKKIPVKGVIRVYRKKVEKAKEPVTALETQFENLSVKIKDLKAETRSSKRAMMWVKKGQNEGGGDGVGSDVKTINA